jgi:tol-pal system protein YbgF
LLADGGPQIGPKRRANALCSRAPAELAEAPVRQFARSFVLFAVPDWRRRLRPAFASIAALAVAGLAAPGFAQESGDSIASRLGRLEDKIKDLQVTIGTLQSFGAKPGAMLSQETPAPIPQAPSAQFDLGPRIDALETQITALTSHLEQIGRQMSGLEERLSALQAAPQPIGPPVESGPPPLRQGEVLDPPARALSTIVPPAADDEPFDSSKPRWYGPKPGSDDLAALLENQAPAEPQGDRPHDLTAALPGGDAQSLYQRGYGALLQKDYAGAEGAFRQLVAAHPNHPLASDAQYWLGETYYVRGQYKSAADAFLGGYQKYQAGQKAPDTLLKLGMSLAALGQKDAACSTFSELKTKFPQAPQHVAEEAKAWRKKTGC